LIENNVKVFSNGNTIIITANDNFKLMRAEVINRLGQIVFVKDLSKSNYSEIDLAVFRDFYLLRIFSENQSFTKKIIVE